MFWSSFGCGFHGLFFFLYFVLSGNERGIVESFFFFFLELFFLRSLTGHCGVLDVS